MCVLVQLYIQVLGDSGKFPAMTKSGKEINLAFTSACKQGTSSALPNMKERMVSFGWLQKEVNHEDDDDLAQS